MISPDRNLYAKCQADHLKMEEAYNKWQELDTQAKKGEPVAHEVYKKAVDNLLASIKTATNQEAKSFFILGSDKELYDATSKHNADRIRHVYTIFHDINTQTLEANKPT